MAVIYNSKYDKLGTLGWFIYIPSLLVAFALIDHEKYRSILLLASIFPILNVIIGRFVEIARIKEILNERIKNPFKKKSILEPEDQSDIRFNWILIIILVLLLGFLIFNATKDYTSMDEFRLVFNNLI